MRVTIARSAAEMDALQHVWEDLHRRSSDATLFQSFRWNRLAAEVFSRRESPYVICVQSEAGVAIIPACRVTGFGLKFLGEQLFDYPDFLRAGDDAVLEAAWHELAQLNLPLRLHGVREMRCKQWPAASVQPFSAAPCIGGEIFAEQFAHQHNRSARSLRKLLRMGTRLRVCSGSRELVYAIYAAKAAQNEDNLFCDPLRREFMEQVAEDVNHPCDIFLLEQGSAMIAAIVSFRDRVARRFYTTYYDPAWAQHSPGAALLYEATRLALEEGLECDYMTGEQPYKMRLATAAKPLFRVEANLRAGRGQELVAKPVLAA